jgi:hypothetical protein
MKSIASDREAPQSLAAGMERARSTAAAACTNYHRRAPTRGALQVVLRASLTSVESGRQLSGLAIFVA